MGRWQTGTAERLRGAALELFVQRGYDATTVDDIVAVAGVTQRTFFRHFADKEEVLFDEDGSMQDILVAAARVHLLEHGSGDGQALAAARSATAALAASFEQERDRHRMRWQVLADVPALQGRQLVKQERWGAALTTALTDGGVPPADASVAVEIASAALRLAYADWLDAARRKRLGPLLAATNDRFDEILRSSG